MPSQKTALIQRTSFLILICASLTTASAQTAYIDLTKAITDSLRAKGTVSVTSIKTVQVMKKMKDIHPELYRHLNPANPAQLLLLQQGNISMPVPVTVKTQDSEYLRATNIRVISAGNFIWGTDSVINLPDKIQETSAICDNIKGAQSLTCSGALSLTYQRTSSITFTQSVSHTQNLSVSANTSVGGFGVSATASFGETSTAGTTTGDANSTTVQVQKNYSVTVAPQTAQLTTMRIWTVEHLVSFTCYVVIDADISQSDRGYLHLSDIFPQSSRTYTVTGFITADDCSTAEIKNLPADIINSPKAK
jgi:hypothetical protein